MAPLDLLGRHLHDVDMDGVRPALADAIRKLRAAGVRLSDRRIVKAQRLVAAASVLAGRLEASPADLWPVLYALPTQAAQQQARDALREVFALAEHPHLHHAVEEATLQPRSRVSRLLDAARACLAPPEDGAPELPAAPRLEAVLREIDANFSADQLPEELAALREQLRTRLRVAEALASDRLRLQ
jgi:MoxR-like ATPase